MTNRNISCKVMTKYQCERKSAPTGCTFLQKLGSSEKSAIWSWLSLTPHSLRTQVPRAGGSISAKRSYAFKKQQLDKTLSWLVCSGFLLPNTSFMLECHINWFLIEQCASNFQNPAEYKTGEVRCLLFEINSLAGKDAVSSWGLNSHRGWDLRHSQLSTQHWKVRLFRLSIFT